LEDRRIAGHFKVIADSRHIIGACFKRDLKELVLFDVLCGNDEDSFAREQVRDAARASEIAAVDFKNLADFASSSIAVVGEDVAKDRDTTGSVTFIDHVVVLLIRRLAAAFLDGSVDILFGHAVLASFVECIPKCQVTGRIATTMSRSNDDCSTEFAEQFAAFFVDRTFSNGDVRRMGMSCHVSFLRCRKLPACGVNVVSLNKYKRLDFKLAA